MHKTTLSAAIAAVLTNAAMTRPDKPQNYYKLSNSAGRNVVNLDGFIGWWDDEASWFKDYLRNHEGEEIELNISSKGGDVFTGQRMHNYLKAHKGHVTCYVEQAFSIASHIAMACDTVKIVKGGQFMIHAVSAGCYGTSDDLEATKVLVENATNAIANSYTDRTGHDVSYWLDIMKNDAGKFFNDTESVEIGLADEVIEPSQMTNYVVDDLETDPEHQDPAPQTPNLTNSTKEEDTMSKQQLDRQKAVRNLFNKLQPRFNLPLSLLNEALDDEDCDLSAATTKFTDYKAEPETPDKTPLNFGGGYGNTGSDAKDMVKNVLLNRAGAGELNPEYKAYAGMDLLNAAANLGVKGYGNALAVNALDSDDFKTVVGEIQQEIVHLEAENNTSILGQVCEIKKKNRLGEYGVTEYNQIDGFGLRNEQGEFATLTFDGKPKRKGKIDERGSKITLTRAALLDDDFSIISDLPRQHVRAAYRSAENLMFARIKEYAVKHSVSRPDFEALLIAMRTHLQEQTTSKGDDLHYNGGLIMTAPAAMNFVRPLVKSAVTTDKTKVNEAYGAFQEFLTATKCEDLFIGVADGVKALELAVIQGMETPELIENNSIDRANGLGWTVVWDFDVQVANAQALVIGKIGAAPQAE